MMGKHTQGPWKAEYGTYGAQWNVVRVGLKPECIVAQCSAGMVADPEHGPQSREADARLIAAAPEMLGALRAIAGMEVDEATDHAQLSALCMAVAQAAVREVEA